ncbi:MAG: DUF1801 domain-containing protein [Chitinophagales bacterium]
MAENKTKETSLSVHAFLDRIDDLQKKKDAYTILEMMQKITHQEPKMWGESIVGFGKVQYQYASGHSGETCVCGFSPRKLRFSLYITCSPDSFRDLLDKLGKHKTGKGCIYIKKLDDIDKKVLETMVRKAVSGSKLVS